MADSPPPEPLETRGTAAIVLCAAGTLGAIWGAGGLWGLDGAALVGGLLAFVFGLALAWQ
jgi:hypothetical protein